MDEGVRLWLADGGTHRTDTIRQTHRFDADGRNIALDCKLGRRRPCSNFMV